MKMAAIAWQRRQKGGMLGIESEEINGMAASIKMASLPLAHCGASAAAALLRNGKRNEMANEMSTNEVAWHHR